jgi:hypothetical protein
VKDDNGKRRRFPGFSWAGASVFVLALCLGGGWATAIVFSASSRTPPITDTTKDLLSTIGGVLAGAITAYIGGVIALVLKDRDVPGGQSTAGDRQGDLDASGPDARPGPPDAS